MKYTGPINRGRPTSDRPKRPKATRPAPPKNALEARRRAAQYKGRDFVYMSKTTANTANRPSGQHPRSKPIHKLEPHVAESHHLTKARGPIRYKRNAKMRNIGLLVAKVALVTAMVCGIYFILTDPRFAISTVSVSGIPAQDQTDVESLVAPDALGHNAFLYWLTRHRKIAEQVESSQADYKTVSVKLSSLNSIDVNVVERTPSMLITIGPDGILGAWMLDDTGLPIRDPMSPRWNERPAGMVKVIIDPKRVSPSDIALIKTGSPLPLSVQKIVTDASSVQYALKISPLEPGVGSIRVDNSGYLGLNMDSHLLIKLGDTDSLDKKLALAYALKSQRADLVSTSRYIDVSDPNWPAIMPISTPTTQLAGGKPLTQSQSWGVPQYISQPGISQKF